MHGSQDQVAEVSELRGKNLPARASASSSGTCLLIVLANLDQILV